MNSFENSVHFYQPSKHFKFRLTVLSYQHYFLLNSSFNYFFTNNFERHGLITANYLSATVADIFIVTYSSATRSDSWTFWLLTDDLAIKTQAHIASFWFRYKLTVSIR